MTCDEVRNAKLVVEVEDVGAVEVGRAVTAAQVKRIVAVVEETQAALFVEGMRVGVRGADQDAVAHALVDVRLKRIVGIDAGGLVVNGLCRVADVGNAKVDVAAFVVLKIGLAVGEVDGNVVVGDGVAVAVVLLVGAPRQRGICGRSDIRLIEWHGNDLMAAQIAHVSEFDGEIVPRLPLDVECVVHGVGQFVGAVVDTERNRPAISSQCCPRWAGSWQGPKPWGCRAGEAAKCHRDSQGCLLRRFHRRSGCSRGRGTA